MKAMHNDLIHLTDKEQRAAAELVVRLRQRFDGRLVSVTLFGSRARGEAGPHSDLDVVVVLSDVDADIRKEVRHLAVEVWLEHGIYISTRVWDRAHWRKLEELRTTFYQNIRRDGLNLLELSPAATP